MLNFARYYVSLRLKFQLRMANNLQGKSYCWVKVVLVEQVDDLLISKTSVKIQCRVMLEQSLTFSAAVDRDNKSVESGCKVFDMFDQGVINN